jgi:cell division protein FtsB
MSDAPRPIVPPWLTGFITGACAVGAAWIVVVCFALLRDIGSEGLVNMKSPGTDMADIAEKQQEGEMSAEIRALAAQVEQLEQDKKQLETELDDCKQRLVDPDF